MLIMVNLLRSVSIPKRLTSQLAICAIGFVVLIFAALSQLYDAKVLERANSTKHFVDIAYSVFEAEHSRFKSGEVSEDEAKANAIETIKQLRYDGNNYFSYLI